MKQQDTLFTQIIKREIPATIVYEDESFIAFKDINPKAPIHVLVVPKKQISTLEEVNLEDSEFHARLLQTIRKVAKKLGISGNYQVMMNIGPDVQQVPHIHAHLMGGWKVIPR